MRLHCGLWRPLAAHFASLHMRVGLLLELIFIEQGCTALVHEEEEVGVKQGETPQTTWGKDLRP